MKHDIAGWPPSTPGVRRAGVALALVAILGVTACATSKSGEPSSKPTTSTSAPTVWQQTLSKIKPDGTVDVSTALSAFVQAIGPVPGVTSPGPGSDIDSGTIAIEWVFAHWAELTSPQQAAVRADLGAPTHRFVALGDPVPPPIDPKIPCQEHDSPSAGRFRKVLDEVLREIDTRLPRGDWPSYNGPAAVILGGEAPAGALASTWGCVGTDKARGPINGCTIHLSSASAALTDVFVRERLAHEAMHCVMYNRFGTLKVAGMAAWYTEGFPTWVQVQLGKHNSPVGLEHWHTYMTAFLDPDKNEAVLARMSYEGIGFFVHLAETGTDPWSVAHSIGAGMIGPSNTTEAGWNNAGVTDAFRNNWGSGFAQGRYPGTPWQTTGQYLDTYSKGVHPLLPLANGSPPVPMDTLAASADLFSLDVTAEVVQVASDGPAYGRISLGDHSDATLDVAQTQTYCTLDAPKCRCPSDSDKAGTQFTHMKPGEVSVGLTGGLAAAKLAATGTSLEDFCSGKKKSPLIGTWKARSTTITAGLGGVATYSTTGAAGVTMTIGKDGTMTVNYSGMAPASYTAKGSYGPLAGHGKVSATGTDSGTLDLERAGVWEPQNLKLGLVATTRMDRGGVFAGRPGESTGNFVGPVLPGTWTITGKTLTVVGSVKSSVGSQHATWTFNRIR